MAWSISKIPKRPGGLSELKPKCATFGKALQTRRGERRVEHGAARRIRLRIALAVSQEGVDARREAVGCSRQLVGVLEALDDGGHSALAPQLGGRLVVQQPW